MPRSMTGFGAAEGVVAGGRLRLEVRTVNHRHLNVQLKVPSELAELEQELRERLRAHLARGHVTVTGRWLEEPPEAASVTVDRARAAAVVSALRAAGKDLGLSGDVDLALLARLPDVLRVAHAEVTPDPGAVLDVLDRAAGACVASREREGEALASELRSRIAALGALRSRIAERAPEAKYVLAHAIGCGPTPDYVSWADMFLDTIGGVFPQYPGNFWIEIRDFQCRALKRTLAEVPSNRLLSGTDWTTRIGPPFASYGTMFGVDEDKNPFPPKVASFVKFLKDAGGADEAVSRIGFENARELFKIK